MGKSERLSDDPDGFARFYEMVFERPLPQHARRDWLEPLYAARREGKGLVVEAFRGSAKTTTLSVAFTAFRLGQEPHKSALLVQAGQLAAQSTSQQIADLIEHNQGWREAFGQVQPDRKVSWGARGYELVDIEENYETWRALCAREKGKDPSFVGLGYRSRALIGKHPTGLLLLDDIHDENNTRPGRDLERVLTILKGTILPTLMPHTWQVFVGTPWATNDALAYLKATGRFISVATPIYRGEKTPAWPERFPAEEIQKARELAGEAEFARMYLLDLRAAEGLHLKAEWLHEYPHKDIQPEWPVVIGVDYASTADKLRGGRRDYFAAAVGRVLPGGGVVLVDGFRARVSQGEAEQQIKSMVARYPTVQAVAVEAVGKGEEFYYLLLRQALLPLAPMYPGRSSKGERFERGMAPLFQWGHAWLANAETPFLRAFREEWLRWPDGEHDDTLDAVYWMLMAAGHQLAGVQRRARRENPFAALGRD
ncbi:MAG: hypothetical protein KIS85_06475 [Anaerolineales bacterium]|nr:hypothetical protein [Anaerolineales bacterium]